MMIAPPPPPALETLRAGTVLSAGVGYSTILPDMDFETFSAAGFVWDPEQGKFTPPRGVTKKGLGVVGAAVYAGDPSTEVLCFAYDLKDGRGRRRWKPGDPPPEDLFAHLAAGGLIEAHNVAFERWIWERVCVPKYGWPALPVRQLRDSMVKAQAFALPAALDSLSDVLDLEHKKDPEGKRLLNKFSIPRKPTKKNPAYRILPQDDPGDFARLESYNDRDIVAEAEASSRCPDLSPEELEYWQDDAETNHRGVGVDLKAVRDCLAIIEQAYARYNTELSQLTGGAVDTASQVERLRGWLGGRGVRISSMDEDGVTEALSREGIPRDAHRALEIRALVGSASVKKLYALLNQTDMTGRIHDLFVFFSARTGRAAGRAAQPQNLPHGGPEIYQCPTCGGWFAPQGTGDNQVCPHCGMPLPVDKLKPQEWNCEAAVFALGVVASRDLDYVEHVFGNAVALVSGCIRSLFVSAPGKDFICSDYNAIEARVLAALAGCEWRLEVFRTHGKIYEMSASKITGIPYEEFIRHKKETGQHLPERGKVGKVAELASGYGGWVGAWKNFGADKFFGDTEIKKHILAWRDASPEIPEFWGGQHRGRPWDPDYRKEYFGLEGSAVLAVLRRGETFAYRGISYTVRGDILYCGLPSGRSIVYHQPRLSPSDRNADEYSLSFMGWNTNPKMGPLGWVRMSTYGGKLCENVVQAVSRDVLYHAKHNLALRGYPAVLHVHDEVICEVPEGFGSVEELEAIMMINPPWAADWPIKASGGWRGKRYRKD